MRKQELFILSITIFITVVLWLIYDLYLNKKTDFDFLENIPKQDTEIRFDAEVFNKLKSRDVYEE